MLPGTTRSDPPARGARHKPLLNEIGFDHIFERTALFTDRCRETFDAYWAAVKFFHDGEQQFAIQRIETLWIDRQQVERGRRDLLIDVSRAAHLRKVAHPP